MLWHKRVRDRFRRRPPRSGIAPNSGTVGLDHVVPRGNTPPRKGEPTTGITVTHHDLGMTIHWPEGWGAMREFYRIAYLYGLDVAMRRYGFRNMGTQVHYTGDPLVTHEDFVEARIKMAGQGVLAEAERITANN